MVKGSSQPRTGHQNSLGNRYLYNTIRCPPCHVALVGGMLRRKWRHSSIRNAMYESSTSLLGFGLSNFEYTGREFVDIWGRPRYKIGGG